jgi:hypothetical protein
MWKVGLKIGCWIEQAEKEAAETWTLQWVEQAKKGASGI